MNLIFFSIFLLVFGIEADECPSYKCSSNSPYVSGNAYYYNFESLYQIKTISNHYDEVKETNGKITGTAKIYSNEDCSFTLQLDKIFVLSSTENFQSSLGSGDIPVKFGLTEYGDIEPKICVDPSDNEFSLNLKRSIISLMATGNQTFETDVFGFCPSIKSKNSKKLTTTKNLKKCIHRENFHLIKGIMKEKLGTSPLLYGDYIRESEFSDNKFVKKVNLREDYKFSYKNKSLVDVAGTTNLVLEQNIEEISPKLMHGESASIIFQVPRLSHVKNSDVLKRQFKKTIETFEDFVKFGSSENFMELLRLMRNSDTDSLIDLAAESSNEFARKIYLDALFRAGTSSSLAAILIQLPKMNEQEKKMAYLSFYLVADVSKENLNQALDLLTNSAPKESYLAMGYLVAEICAKKSSICNESYLSRVTKKFTDNLKKCKAQSKADEDRIIFILKGIKNSRKIGSSIIPTLRQCVQVSSSRIQVAALQAFSSAPCNSDLQETAINLLHNINEDSEIRIESYLAALNCPSTELATKIEKLINNEPTNQVGTFISSHLRALKESSDKSKESQKYYMENIRVTKKFDVDWRRYSFATDNSFSFESLGIGASSATNTIYGLQGYLPRSIRWNVTSKIFGNEIDLWDLSIRQENMEAVIENLFSSTTTKNRFKRGLKEEAEKFSNKYITFNSVPTFDISLKFFGSEMFFLSLDDFGEINLSNLLLDNQKIETHSLFLDTRIIYPTGMGLPLELSAQGMSANKIIFEYEHNKNKWFLKCIPSFDISISAALSIDFHAFKNGVKTTSVVHTATGVDAKLAIDKETIENFSSLIGNVNSGFGNWSNFVVKRSTDVGSDKFMLSINIPSSSSKIIQFKHVIGFTHHRPAQEEKITQLLLKKRSSQDQCFEQLLIFGAKLCYRVDIADYGYAEFSLSLSLEKEITLVGSQINKGNSQGFALVYDTPGSKNQHTSKFTALFGLVPDTFARFEFEFSNINKLYTMELGFKNTEMETYVYIKHSDDSENSIYKAGFSRSENEYHPLLESNINGQKEASLAGYKILGKVTANDDVYSLNNVKLVTPSTEISNLEGKITVRKDTILFDLQFNKKTSVKGIFNLSGKPSYKLGLFIDENGGEIYITTGEFGISMKGGDTDLNISSKYDKEKVVAHLEWLKKKSKYFEILFNGEKSVDNFELKVFFEKSGGKIAGLSFSLSKDIEFKGRAFFNRHFLELEGKKISNKISCHLKSSFGLDFILSGAIGEKWTIGDHFIDIRGKLKINPDVDEIKLHFKSSASHEKYLADGDISQGNINFLLWNAEVHKSEEKPLNGKGNFKIYEYINTSINFKFNQKNGKGEVAISTTVKGIPEEIKISAKYLRFMPKLEVEILVTKGLGKRYLIKSQNLMEKNKILSKNVVSWGKKDEDIQVNITASYKNDEMFNELKLSLKGYDLTGKIERKTAKTGSSTDFSVIDNKNIFNAQGKIEKYHKNVKAKIEINLEDVKFDCSLQKLENTYSYDLNSGKLHSMASWSPQEISFILNDLKIDAKRDGNITSISFKNNDIYLKSTVLFIKHYFRYEHESSFEKFRSLIISYDYMKEKQKALLDVNGKQFGFDYNSDDKYMELIFYTPSRRSKLSMSADIETTKKKGKWCLEFENFLDFSGKHIGNFNLENIQSSDVFLNLELNGKLVYQLELISKGEKMHIDIKGEKSNIIRGSLNYAVNQEPNKSYIEGEGELTVGEKKAQANFRVMRQLFVTSSDSESGVKFSFTGNFNERTTINFIKFSDRELHVKFCLCDEKKECANVELETREGKLLAIVDLKTFGVPYEFDLKSNYNQELIFDARLIDRSNKESYKISSSVSVLSQKIFIKINSKEVSFQASTKLPVEGIYGYYEQKMEIGFDKDEKTKVLFAANLSEISFRLNWELIHPTIKTLLLSTEIIKQDQELNCKIICDAFNEKDKEIFLGFEMKDFNNLIGYISSKGLNINKRLSIKNIQSPFSEIDLIYQDNDIEVLSYKADGNTDKMTIGTKVLNKNLITITLEKQSDNRKISVNILENNSKFQINSNKNISKVNSEIGGVLASEVLYIPGNEISVMLSGKNGPIYERALSLEKSRFLEQIRKEGNTEQLNEIRGILKNYVFHICNVTEERLIEMRKKISDISLNEYKVLEESLPNIASVTDYLKKKISEISAEMDKDFGEIGLYLRKYEEKVIITFEKLTGFFKKIIQILYELQVPMDKFINEKLIKAIKLIVRNVVDLFEILAENIFQRLELIDFSIYLKPALPFVETLVDVIENIYAEFETLPKMYKEISNSIPSFHDIIENLNNKLIEFKIADQFLELLYNILIQMKSIAPESTELCDKLYNYIKMKFNGEKVEDLAIVKELLNLLKRSHFYINLPFENMIPRFDQFVPHISLSVFKLFESFFLLHDLHLMGHILPDGGYISFDGKFSTYSRNCRLILAQEISNGNFTIIGNFKNGQLKMISLIENESIIELTDNGMAKLNGKSVDWPIISFGRILGLKEWKKWTIKGSESDVEINCFKNLKHCHIIISYLYTGKVRGILGNGNGEVFDDFTLPNGSIADSSDKFVSSYGLSSCEDLVPLNTQPCQNIFTWDSTMSVAFPFISTAPFKDACGLISKCDIAFSYVSAAQLKNIPAVLPTECLECEDKKDYGENFPVKIPSNKADVVFVLDLDVSASVLHDLFKPTISGIHNDLSDLNFSDLNIGIIGYTTKYSDPLIINSNIENITIIEKEKNLIERLIPKTFTRSDEKAFELAMRYPFRALATKTIIVMRADGLVLNIGNLGRAILYSAAAEMRGILLQVVQPVSGLVDDVIGFNNKLTVPLKGPRDAKKRINLKYRPNVSIENVLQSGGWVFDYNKFKDLTNSGDKKSYVHQLTSSIAENLFRTEIVGNCKCITYDGLYGTNNCMIVKNVNTSKKIKPGKRR